MEHYYKRDTCRLCGSTHLTTVLSLTPTPPANNFVGADELANKQKCYPLDLAFCEECTHLQLVDVVDPNILFRKYVYVSGTSPVFVNHFRDYASALTRSYAVEKDALVVDIGSNDGTLLKFFKGMGMRVQGVDPAIDIAKNASDQGIPTRADFFNQTVAHEISQELGKAQIVVANNVFAHIDDLSEIVEGIKVLLDDNGIFSFEVSYLLDVFEKTLFDTMYHEHLCYHSVKALKIFFERHGMELIDAQRVDTHGGSLRAIAQLKGGSHPIKNSVNEMIQLESEAGLDKAETFQDFGERIDNIGKELKELLLDLRAQGKRVAGFGAPAKATTLMHHFGIDASLVDYIIDDSHLKQNLYTPGFHIPVLPATVIQTKKPDYILILAWNFAKPIIEKHSDFMTNGGHFITPLPHVEVIS